MSNNKNKKVKLNKKSTITGVSQQTASNDWAPGRDLIQTMEKSNYLKKKARIVEGGITRAEIHEANVLLKSSELVLCVVGLYHLLKGWQGPESPVNLSDIRLFIPA